MSISCPRSRIITLANHQLLHQLPVSALICAKRTVCACWYRAALSWNIRPPAITTAWTMRPCVCSAVARWHLRSHTFDLMQLRCLSTMVMGMPRAELSAPYRPCPARLSILADSLAATHFSGFFGVRHNPPSWNAVFSLLHLTAGHQRYP